LTECTKRPRQVRATGRCISRTSCRLVASV